MDFKINFFSCQKINSFDYIELLENFNKGGFNDKIVNYYNIELNNEKSALDTMEKSISNTHLKNNIHNSKILNPDFCIYDTFISEEFFSHYVKKFETSKKIKIRSILDTQDLHFIRLMRKNIYDTYSIEKIKDDDGIINLKQSFSNEINFEKINFINKNFLQKIDQSDNQNDDNLSSKKLKIFYDTYLNENYINKKFIEDPNFLREMASITRTNYTIVSSDLELALLKKIFPFKKNNFIYLPFLYDKHEKFDLIINNFQTNNKIISNKNDNIDMYKNLFSKKRNYVFIGNYLHTPNRDTAIFISKILFPKIIKKFEKNTKMNPWKIQSHIFQNFIYLELIWIKK
jgi:hypothetical protein